MNFGVKKIILTLVRRTSWEQAKEKTFVMVQAGTEEGDHTRAVTRTGRSRMGRPQRALGGAGLSDRFAIEGDIENNIKVSGQRN